MELTIEKILECKKVKEFLDDVCEKYFKTHAYEWEIYSDWKFSDDHPEHIVISYAYFDWRGEYEAGEQTVHIKTLIEFSKTLNK
jgi:hypothetical protein